MPRGDMIPVLITAEDGRSMQLGVDPTAQLRTIGEAVAKKFRIAAGSQVLKYNGDPLLGTQSLQSAGALLLKGEPYVKLALSASRGNSVNIIVRIPGGKDIPLSVPDATTFGAVKKRLLKDHSPDLTYEGCRIYQDNNPVSDKATLAYHHVKNNSRFELIRRLEVADVEQKHSRRSRLGFSDRDEGGLRDGEVFYEEPKRGEQRSRKVNINRSTYNDRPRTANTSSYSDHRGYSAPPARRTTFGGTRSPTTTKGATKRSEGYGEEDADFRHLANSVASLQDLLIRRPDGSKHVGDDVVQSQIRNLKEEVAFKDRQLREALIRVKELEASLDRYRGLLLQAVGMKGDRRRGH